MILGGVRRVPEPRMAAVLVVWHMVGRAISAVVLEFGRGRTPTGVTR